MFVEPATGHNLHNTRRVLKWSLRIMIGFLALCFACFFGLWAYAKIAGPPPIKVPETTIFYTAKGKVFAEAEHQSQNRFWVKIDDISKPLIKATVAIEDKRFFTHNGFDMRRILGSAVADLSSFSKAQGASTITMQLARNLYLYNDKTWTRKFLEVFYAMRLEMHYSKKEILEAYLNTIYYGNGAYGVEAASRYYFGKEAKDLTLSEASLLAGIPKGPTYYAPDENFDNAKKRQRLILNEMAKDHYISKKEAVQAYHTPLHLLTNHESPPRKAPYFEDMVQKELRDRLHMDEKTIATSGLKIYTTLDLDLQKKAEFWVKHVINPDSTIQAALVAMDPKTGAVKALVGGRDYQKDAYNMAASAKRQPGSSFKPFLYYAALKNGFTPSTLLTSEPTTFRYDDGRGKYSPENFGGYYADGPITLMQALALSDNIYAVKTHLAIGMDKLVDAARKMGITSPLSPIPSLALGTKEVSVLEMARAYSTIANLGTRVTPHFITKVVDKSGNTIYEWQPKKEKVLDPATSFVLSQLMTGIFDPKLNDYTKVTGYSVRNLLSHKVAAKTGSTDTDSWMVGFTPQLTTAVWVGYKDHASIKTYPDATYSKKIWANFMEEALAGKPKNSFKAPDGVVKVWVDPDTGKLATDACPNARLTYYLEGTEPTEYCDKHKGRRYVPGEKDHGPTDDLLNRLKNLLPW
jgi:1A family penicillin-binding protein